MKEAAAYEKRKRSVEESLRLKPDYAKHNEWG